MKRTVADRSAHDNGFQITGNVVKEAVATGSELSAFVGSSNNYLTQPHNSDLDVIGDGTAHPYTMMGWFTNQTNDSYMGGQAILLTANLQTDQFISWQFNANDGSVGVWVKTHQARLNTRPQMRLLKINGIMLFGLMKVVTSLKYTLTASLLVKHLYLLIGSLQI